MKSVHYAASVVSVYRRAVDACWADPEHYTVKQEWLEELEKVSHRPYTTGFAPGKPDETAQNYATSSYLQTHEFVGLVRSWQQGRLTVEQRNQHESGGDAGSVPPGRQPGKAGTGGNAERRRGSHYGGAAPPDGLHLQSGRKNPGQRDPKIVKEGIKGYGTDRQDFQIHERKRP